MEFAFGEQRQHGAFGAEQPADEGVDRDEQGELGGVGADPQPHRARAGHVSSIKGFPVACAQSSAPPSSTET